MDDDTKHPLKSLGIMGPLISILVLLLNQWKPGLGINDADAASIVNNASALIGAITAIYGRWTATQKISLTPAQEQKP